MKKDRSEEFDFNNDREEDVTLSVYSPLKSVMYLAIGPLISELTVAMTGVVNSLYVAKAIGDEGVEVFGAIFVVEFIGVAFSQYFSAAMSIRTSYLHGLKKVTECGQLYVDLLRLSLIVGAVVPCITLPSLKPLVIWFGASEELAELCFEYMLPHEIGLFATLSFMTSCGLLQGEGKSFLFGVFQITVFILAHGLIEPVLLFGFKTKIWGAGISNVLAQFIVTIIMLILVFKGKFVTKPMLQMFLNKPSKETPCALRVGFSTFLENVSLNIPLILVQKYYNMAATAMGIYNEMIMVWAVHEKVSYVICGLCVGIAQGMSPAVSYAYGAARLKRLLWLGIHALWTSTTLSSVLSLFVLTMPRTIASWWSKDPKFLDLAEQSLPIAYYTVLCLAIQYIVPAILPAMKMVMRSVNLSILTLLLPQPFFGSILYFTNKTDPVRLFYMYTCNDIYSMIVDVLFMIKPMKILLNAPNDDEEGLQRPQDDYSSMGMEEEDKNEEEAKA